MRCGAEGCRLLGQFCALDIWGFPTVGVPFLGGFFKGIIAFWVYEGCPPYFRKSPYEERFEEFCLAFSGSRTLGVQSWRCSDKEHETNMLCPGRGSSCQCSEINVLARCCYWAVCKMPSSGRSRGSLPESTTRLFRTTTRTSTFSSSRQLQICRGLRTASRMGRRSGQCFPFGLSSYVDRQLHQQLTKLRHLCAESVLVFSSRTGAQARPPGRRSRQNEHFITSLNIQATDPARS